MDTVVSKLNTTSAFNGFADDALVAGGGVLAVSVGGANAAGSTASASTCPFLAANVILDHEDSGEKRNTYDKAYH